MKTIYYKQRDEVPSKSILPSTFNTKFGKSQTETKSQNQSYHLPSSFQWDSSSLIKSEDRDSHYASANLISAMQFYLDYHNLSKRSSSLVEKEDITLSTVDKSQTKDRIKRKFTHDKINFKEVKKSRKLQTKLKLGEIASTPAFVGKANLNEKTPTILQKNNTISTNDYGLFQSPTAFLSKTSRESTPKSSSRFIIRKPNGSRRQSLKNEYETTSVEREFTNALSKSEAHALLFSTPISETKTVESPDIKRKLSLETAEISSIKIMKPHSPNEEDSSKTVDNSNSKNEEQIILKNMPIFPAINKKPEKEIAEVNPKCGLPSTENRQTESIETAKSNVIEQQIQYKEEGNREIQNITVELPTQNQYYDQEFKNDLPPIENQNVESHEKRMSKFNKQQIEDNKEERKKQMLSISAESAESSTRKQGDDVDSKFSEATVKQGVDETLKKKTKLRFNFQKEKTLNINLLEKNEEESENEEKSSKFNPEDFKKQMNLILEDHSRELSVNSMRIRGFIDDMRASSETAVASQNDFTELLQQYESDDNIAKRHSLKKASHQPENKTESMHSLDSLDQSDELKLSERNRSRTYVARLPKRTRNSHQQIIKIRIIPPEEALEDNNELKKEEISPKQKSRTAREAIELKPIENVKEFNFSLERLEELENSNNETHSTQNIIDYSTSKADDITNWNISSQEHYFSFFWGLLKKNHSEKNSSIISIESPILDEKYKFIDIGISPLIFTPKFERFTLQDIQVEQEDIQMLELILQLPEVLPNLIDDYNCNQNGEMIEDERLSSTADLIQFNDGTIVEPLTFDGPIDNPSSNSSSLPAGLLLGIVGSKLAEKLDSTHLPDKISKISHHFNNNNVEFPRHHFPRTL